MIAVISHAEDLHASTVLSHLQRAGADSVRLDTGQVPKTASVTSRHTPEDPWQATWTDAGGGHDLTRIRVAWWRRPLPYGLHDDLVGVEDRGFAYAECDAAVAGLWACLDATWVNDPDRDAAASRKVWQLKTAAALGLRVPRTCITNDPEQARAFVAAEPAGGVIYKPFGGTEATWRETRVLRPGDAELLDHVRFAPVIFQERIPGGLDIRATIVGTDVYAAEIRAHESAYEVDFRMDAQVPDRIHRHELPAQVTERLLAYQRRAGLVYGAADLRLTPQGEYVFLEVNPAGQWLFVELATELPISAAMAGLLARLDRPVPAAA